MIGPILLSLALSVTGIRVVENREACSYEPDLMGEYVLDSRTISICTDNVSVKGKDYHNVLNHEVVHAIHHNLGWERNTILHPELITILVRQFIPDGETMAVLLNYDGYTDQEFEARLLNYLPSDAIALLLIISHLM